LQEREGDRDDESIREQQYDNGTIPRGREKKTRQGELRQLCLMVEGRLKNIDGICSSEQKCDLKGWKVENERCRVKAIGTHNQARGMG
jgi:hypothetical protein